MTGVLTIYMSDLGENFRRIEIFSAAACASTKWTNHKFKIY